MVGLSVVEVRNLRFLLCFAGILVLLIVGGIQLVCKTGNIVLR